MATPNDVADIIEPLSQEILHGNTNWFTVEFASTGQKNKYELKLCNKGTGGLAELRQNLTDDDRIFYGLLQVNLLDENGSKYDKYVYFKYLPNKANKIKRGLWGWENPIKTAFKFKHVSMEYLDENLTGFNEEGIAKEFLRVSENQMEYKSIDFGAQNIYLITNGNIKKGRPADMGYAQPKNNNNNNNNAAAHAAQDEKVDYPDEPVQQPNDNNDNNDNNNNNDNDANDDNDDNANDDNNDNEQNYDEQNDDAQNENDDAQEQDDE